LSRSVTDGVGMTICCHGRAAWARRFRTRIAEQRQTYITFSIKASSHMGYRQLLIIFDS
jgi:hypothetical protein